MKAGCSEGERALAGELEVRKAWGAVPDASPALSVVGGNGAHGAK